MGKKEKLLMYTTVMALLIVFAGATYAFFTANNSNYSASTVAVTGGAMKITYSDGTEEIGGKLISTNFQPSNDILVDKTFTLTGKNTATGNGEEGLDMEYSIGIEYVSTFTDGQLHWYLKRMNTNSNITASIIGDIANIPGTNEEDYNHGTFNQDDVYVKLVTGVFKPNNSEQSITFNLKMQFPDTGENQDKNKGAIFNGWIVINGERKKLGEYIALLGTNEEIREDNGLEYDGTVDNNLRYVGATPKNYIKYNDETWRIIGIVDGYVKIIRQDTIRDASGNGLFRWASSNINDWTTASLQTYLNGDYYNSLSDVAKNQIQERTWNLGGWNKLCESAADMYSYERGTTVYSGRPTTWDGKIALMYPSDYGYASTNTECRSCLSSRSCLNSNWMYTSQMESENDISFYREATLTPNSFSSVSAFYVDSSGFINCTGFGNYYSVNYEVFSARPVLYLKSNISIVKGNGSSVENAYVIE